MLTARAEYRLRLRADNADSRLTAWADSHGAISAERRAFQAERGAQRDAGRIMLRERSVGADEMIRAGAAVAPDHGRRPLDQWLRYPEVDDATLLKVEPSLADIPPLVRAELIQDGRYAPYLARQDQEIARLRADEGIGLAAIADYHAIAGLSIEMVERLNAARPVDLAAAGRVRGITPAALAAILVHARRRAA